MKIVFKKGLINKTGWELEVDKDDKLDLDASKKVVVFAKQLEDFIRETYGLNVKK